MNRTSMSLFTGPAGHDGAPQRVPAAQEFSGDAAPTNGVHWAWPQQGWLLTGDATLGDDRVLERFVRFFGASPADYLSRTIAFTAPHHGSERNFSPKALRELRKPPIAVIPAGDKTHFDHPSDAVLDELREWGVEVVHVHERSFAGFRHDLVF